MTLTSLFGKVTKRAWGLAAIATAVVAIPAGLLAWGPDRPTFTMKHPADHVTFNSITDNPVHGDERNFVQIRNVTDNGRFGENVSLTPGKEYEVYVFYHNDAASNLNDAAHNYKGIATGAYMRTDLPATVAAGTNGRVNGYVGASNASPKEVWDEAYMKNNTAGAIDIRIVSGSAKITSNGSVNGKTLPDSLFTSGTKIGYNALDGKLPGCTEYSGYVTYRFKADQPNFTVDKTVSAHGTSQYSETVKANAGDQVDFKIKYQNTGTTQQNDVVIRDKLPANLSYVAGTTYISNSATGNQWKAVAADTVTAQGINIGSYAPGGAGFVKFTAKVAAKDALKCGENKLVNTASADTKNGSKSDTATVTVDKTCEVEKVKACNLKTKQIEQVEKSKIDDVNYTLDLDKCKEEKTIEVCRLSDKKYPVTIKESEFDSSKYSKNPDDCKEEKTIEVCRLSDKKYPVTIKESEFDSTKYSKDPNDCKEEEKTIKVCRLSDKVYPVTIKESDFDSSKYSKNPDDCKTTEDKDIIVCRLSDKKYPVTIKESEFDSTKYSKDAKDCETTTVEKIKVCRISDKKIVKIDKSDYDSSKYTTDFSKCEKTETPETPAELPHTGITDGVLSILGLGSLVGVAGAYIASRRKSL